MHHRHQHVLVVADPEKHCPQGNFAGEVKRVTRRGADGLVQAARRPSGRIDDVPAELGPIGRHYHLLGNPVRGDKQRAQALVTGHHVGQRGSKRLGIKLPAQPQRRRDVVNR